MSTTPANNGNTPPPTTTTTTTNNKKSPSISSKPSSSSSSSSQVLSEIFFSVFFILLEIGLLVKIRDEAEPVFERGENPYAQTSVVWPILATTIYLLGVVGFGRRYFRDREPWNVDGFMIAYNAFQTVFNMWAVAGFLMEIYRRGLPFAGTWYKAGPEEARLGFLIYCHYQNKFLELLDTVWMVVRKKNDQVTFLHVWHHCIIMWSWLLVLWVNPGGDAYFGSLLNSLIHVVMYGYYLMSALKIPCPWKKYVTVLQLSQFSVIFVQGWYAIYLGSTPTWLTLVQQFVMVNMLVLFTSFYMKSYTDKKKSKKDD
jgi:elongation of very long chain fatty acids protein 4